MLRRRPGVYQHTSSIIIVIIIIIIIIIIIVIIVLLLLIILIIIIIIIILITIIIITCQRWVTSPLWSALCRVFCFYCPNARGGLGRRGGTCLANRQVGSSLKGSLSAFYRRKSVEHKPALLNPHPLSSAFFPITVNRGSTSSGRRLLLRIRINWTK